MQSQQAQQLYAGVTRSAYYTNLDHRSPFLDYTASYKQKPPEGGFCNSSQRLTLGELFPAASFTQTDFLTFNFTSIASDQTGGLQDWLEVCVVVDQSASDTVANCTSLAVFTAA
jgi:hypothetical protein